jgi:hypothetical protein
LEITAPGGRDGTVSLHDQLKKELSYVIHNHYGAANNTLESTTDYRHQKELQTHSKYYQ